MEKQGWGRGAFSVMLPLPRGEETHMETQSPVCFHCVGTEHPWKHMYVLRIQTGGNGNTLHALLLSTVLSSGEDSAVTLTVSLSLVTSLSPPLTSHCSMVLFSPRNSSFMETACQFLQQPPSGAPLLSARLCNDCRAKPAAPRLTGKSQAELAALLVNNKS